VRRAHQGKRGRERRPDRLGSEPQVHPTKTSCSTLCVLILRFLILKRFLALAYRKFSDTFMFLPLRDHSGTVQLVLKGSHDNEGARRTLQDLSAESVVCIEGRVVARDQATINPRMATGDIEVEISNIQILNKTHKSLPFQPSSQALVGKGTEPRCSCSWQSCDGYECSHNEDPNRTARQTKRSV